MDLFSSLGNNNLHHLVLRIHRMLRSHSLHVVEYWNLELSNQQSVYNFYRNLDSSYCKVLGRVWTSAFPQHRRYEPHMESISDRQVPGRIFHKQTYQHLITVVLYYYIHPGCLNHPDWCSIRRWNIPYRSATESRD